VYECLGIVGVQALAERERFVLQFFAAPVDELRDRSGDAVAQHGQVVLVAEIVSQLMKFVRHLVDRVGAGEGTLAFDTALADGTITTTGRKQALRHFRQIFQLT